MTEQTPAQSQAPVTPEPTTETPVIEEKKPRKKWLIPTIVAAALVAVSTAGYFLYQNKQLKKQLAEQTKTTSVETADSTADWKTYKNEEYGLWFKYPKSVILEDKSVSGIVQIVLAAQDFRETKISAERQEPIDLYLDQTPFGDIEIDGTAGKTYFLPKGYCDGPTCTAPILAAVVYKDGFRYVFSVFVGQGSDAFTDLEKQILSTFKFLSELKSLDETWNLYTNHLLSFSIKIPKMATGGAPCVWKGEDEGDHSYRPATGLVPVRVFEHDNGVYLSQEYRYELTGETKENNRGYFSGCEKETTTLAYLQEGFQSWHIISEQVANDQELELFIKKHFQPACELGEKKESRQPGVYDVSIKPDGLPMGESQCFINAHYALKYAPDLERAFTWSMGQSLSFCIDNWETCYDSEMDESFTVLGF